MIAAILQFIKEHKCFILGFVVSVAVGYYVHTENHSLKIHLKSAKLENQQLHKKVNSFKVWLRSITIANQRILAEKKGLLKEIDQNIVELQSIKEKNQKLLGEKQEFQKKIHQISTELESSKSKNQRLLAKKKELQKQINAALQSVKDNNQRLLAGEKEFQKKIDQINSKLLQLLGEKVKLIEKNNANHDEHKTQVLHIQKWIESIEKLEEDLRAIIHKIAELHNRKTIIKNIDLIKKYTKQCRKFLDAILFKKVEEMNTLQVNNRDMDKEMEEFKEEVSHFYKYQRNEEAKIIDQYEQKTTPGNGLQELSTAVSLVSTAVSVASAVGSLVSKGAYVAYRVASFVSGFFW